MKRFVWENCSDRAIHAFRINDRGQHERVSICGEVYHPKISRTLTPPRQMMLPLVCSVCEKMERVENRQEEAANVS